MSLYNMIMGFNPACLLFLPMLGKHPDEYPQFRDCFIGSEEHPEYDKHILVYTRIGGNNRSDYFDEINELRGMDNYVADYDDSFDSTFATFVFKVPDRWKEDFNKLIGGDGLNISPEYIMEMKRVYPKLIDKIDELFRKI
jgi:hypothetical protein